MALRHYSRSAAHAARVTARVLALWDAFGPSGFREEVAAASALVRSGQVHNAGLAAQYLQAIGEVQGLPRAASVVVPEAFGGTTVSGAPLGRVLEYPTMRVWALIESGADTATATKVGTATLARIVNNEVVQAGVDAEAAGIVGDESVGGFTRLAVPPACNRCIILAGSWWEWNEGFQRHPKCDCRHVPVADAANIKDVSIDPYRYFDSLSKPEQDRVFTAGDARAIREGGDIFRVVNARKGMYRSPRSSRVGRMSTAEIYRVAGSDRARAVHLLRRHGYIKPQKHPTNARLAG